MTSLSRVASVSRVVRVFVSSTFRDFGEERDLLMKCVFPELRRRAGRPPLKVEQDQR
jgi:hypothetical protein